MGRITTRKAVFLCVIALLQEFGPAHFVEINPAVQKIEKEDGQKSSEDQEAEKDSFDATHMRVPYRSKRGVSWILKLVKALRTVNTVASYVSATATLADAIYSAIAGCCGAWPEGCNAAKQITTMNQKANEIRRKTEEIELEVKNLLARIQVSLRTFDSIVLQLNRIQDQQDAFLATVAVNLKVKLAEKDKTVGEYIIEKETLLQQPEFGMVVDMYSSAIQNAAAITTAGLALAEPAAERLFERCKLQQAVKRTNKAAVKTKAGQFKLPSRNSPQYRGIRLNRHQAAIQRNKILETKLQNRANIKLKRGNMIRTRIFKGLRFAFRAITTGLEFYFIISNWKSCAKQSEKAIQSRDNMKGSLKELDQILINITQAKEMIGETFTDFRSQLTSDDFSDGLKYVMEMVMDLNTPENNNMNQVAVDIQHFLDHIKVETSIQGTQQLQEKLLDALRKVSTPVICYMKEVQTLRYIAEKCQKGHGSLDELYNDAEEMAALSGSKINCASATGSQLIKRNKLKKGVVNMARSMNFAVDCQANNPKTIKKACVLEKRGCSTKTIARLVRLTESTVKIILSNCASLGVIRDFVCRMKERFQPKYNDKWVDKAARILKVKPEEILKVNC